jgi:hypothetical protein
VRGLGGAFSAVGAAFSSLGFASLGLASFMGSGDTSLMRVLRGAVSLLPLGRPRPLFGNSSDFSGELSEFSGEFSISYQQRK